MGYFKTFGCEKIYSGSRNKPATGDIYLDISQGGDAWYKYDGSAWSTGSVFDTCPAALIRNNPALRFQSIYSRHYHPPTMAHSPARRAGGQTCSQSGPPTHAIALFGHTPLTLYTRILYDCSQA